MRKRTQYSNNRGNGGANRGRRGGGQQRELDPNAVTPRQRAQAVTQRDKYTNMAKDALSGGDRVQAEYYFQHADHYNRVIDSADEQKEARDAERKKQHEERQAAKAQRDAERRQNEEQEDVSEEVVAEEAQEEEVAAPVDEPEVEAKKRPVRRTRKPKVAEVSADDAGAQLEDVLPTANA